MVNLYVYNGTADGDYNSSHNGTADGDYVIDHLDHSRGLHIFRWIIECGIIPVSVLGLAGNALSVWMCAILRKQPIYLLFMYLGMVDFLFLLAITARWSIYLTGKMTAQSVIGFTSVTFLSQILSVHTTMMIAAYRWLVLRFYWARHLMRHINKTCGGLGAWCAVLTVLYIVEHTTLAESSTELVVMDAAMAFMGFILPYLFLQGFSIGLFVIIRRHHQRIRRIDSSGKTVTILWMTGFTCLGYPVGMSVIALLYLQKAGVVQIFTCNWICTYALDGVIVLFQALNSSVNFVIYCCSMGRFRQLLRQKLGHVFNAVGNLFRPVSAALIVNDEVREEEEECVEEPPLGICEGRPPQVSGEEPELAEATTSV